MLEKDYLKLVQWITYELPNDGEWWSNDSNNKFIKVAEFLFKEGIHLNDIKDVLSDLYSAMSEEYGG